MTEENTEDVESASLFRWILLIFIASTSFWCQATVTEERFVPALNVIADAFNIPDDVAGATLMAAGASSPELFSSVVSLFITHSAIGLGTIVGSEVFNQLVICAGAVLAARSGTLVLDKPILFREVGFYTLSIILLYFAMDDVRPDPDDPDGLGRIYISFYDGLLLFGGFICYVLVCANFPAITAFFLKKKDNQRASSMINPGLYGAVSSSDSERAKKTNLKMPEEMFYIYETKDEPPTNFFKGESSKEITDAAADTDPTHMELYQTLEPGSVRAQAAAASGGENNPMTDTMRDFIGKLSERLSVRFGTFLLDTEKPSNQHQLYEVLANEFDESLSCFLWQRSQFYTKTKIAVGGWNLRWFTFHRDVVTSVPDRVKAERHEFKYPKFSGIEVDESHLLLKLIAPGHNDYYFMAPSQQIFEAVVQKCEIMANIWEKAATGDDADADPLAANDDDEFNDEEEGDPNAVESLVEFPHNGVLTLIIFLILFPLSFLMHWTIPDVRVKPSDDKGRLLTYAFLAIFSCLCWLIVGSYAMVTSLEALAKLLEIPDAVIGVTVSAAGTSLPNYVASQVAARQGFGNMAVSNAFGSNTFNILVGLGLPWLVYGAVFGHYNGLKNEGILASVIILALVLAVFIVLMIMSNATLHRWHAPLFFFLYAVYIGYSIGTVYL